MNRLFLIILSCALLLFTGIVDIFAEQASEPVLVEGQILDYGIMEMKGRPIKYKIPNTERHAIISGFDVVETTDIIPLKKGILFGIVWGAVGFPTDKEKIVHHVEHPPMKLPSGKIVTESKEPMYIYPENGLFGSVDGYGFHHSHEMLPGQWTYSIIYNAKVIVTKSFTIKEMKN